MKKSMGMIPSWNADHEVVHKTYSYQVASIPLLCTHKPLPPHLLYYFERSTNFLYLVLKKISVHPHRVHAFLSLCLFSFSASSLSLPALSSVFVRQARWWHHRRPGQKRHGRPSGSPQKSPTVPHSSQSNARRSLLLGFRGRGTAGGGKMAGSVAGQPCASVVRRRRTVLRQVLVAREREGGHADQDFDGGCAAQRLLP